MSFLPGRRAMVALPALLLSSALSAQAPQPFKPDPSRGQQVVSGVCSNCHAADGNSTLGDNPKLAGQHAQYLYKQLVDFSKAPTAKDARVSAIMSGFAAGLSDADKRNVAAYLSQQKLTLGAASNKDTLALGQRIYRAGIPGKNVPACAGCHAPNGLGIPAQYPRLSGQHAQYTETTLKAFRAGTRRNSEVMEQIAVRLSEEEMAAVADYIAGLR